MFNPDAGGPTRIARLAFEEESVPMTRLLTALAVVASIALATGALAQTAAPTIQSTTVDNIKITGVAAPMTATPAPGTTASNTDLLKNYQSGVPVMPVLKSPTSSPTKDCAGAGC